MNSFTVTTSTGQTITRNSARVFSHCVVYVGNEGAAHAAWTGSRALAEKEADKKRKSAAKKDTVVAGMRVEILTAVRA